MANKTSQHILSTSANLLGFCLFVITSFHISNKAVSSIIDEFTSIIAILLIFSCFFSFLSIRTPKVVREQRLEKTADYLFISAIIGVLVIILLIALHVIQ